MSEYEGILIFDPELTEEERGKLEERIKEIIEEGKGEIEGITRWGRRKLAYPVKKSREGFYILLNFKLESKILEDITRSFRLTDSILKYLITKK
ncbi:MAG: 30S ribosomal protein S6 [bacterium]|nr:30S ribosomal protein S6 [bacterium]